MNKTIVPIKGMHCRSCELLIEEGLQELPEIKNVQVSYKKNQALIYSKSPLNMENVSKAVLEAGYEVGVNDSKSWISRDPAVYRDLIASFIILAVLYFFANKFGVFNINTGGSGNPSSLIVVLLIGLTAGLSTCMALVGGLVLGISARHAEKHPEATPIQRFRPHLFFNLGRIASYFLLGGMIGLIGKAFQLSGPTLGFLTITVGLIMLFLGLQLIELFPRLSNGGFTLPSSISKFLGIKKHHDKEYSHVNSVLVGALTFFLPCGFTQAMQLFAMSTGSFTRGALIMGLFAIGTAPGLLGVGGLASIVQGSLSKKFFKFVGLLVIFLAVFNLSNGYNLTGWRVFSSGAKEPIVREDPNVKEENGFQVVLMNQIATGYSPNKFTVKKNKQVKWIIDSKDNSSCAASIYVPKLGIRKFLSKGENIIEFTPKEEGEIKFTCAMGMYSGKFIVTNDSSGQLDKSDQKANDSNDLNSDVNQTDNPDAVSSDADRDSSAASGDVATNSKDTASLPKKDSDIQVVRATYVSNKQDIAPNEFTVSAGKPVRFEVLVKEEGQGCMSTIMIPGLANKPEYLAKGETLKFEFTPQKKGEYNITCAMGVPRGILKVV